MLHGDSPVGMLKVWSHHGETRYLGQMDTLIEGPPFLKSGICFRSRRSVMSLLMKLVLTS